MDFDLYMILLYTALGLGLLGFYLFGMALMDFYRKQWQLKTRIKLICLGLVLIGILYVPLTMDLLRNLRRREAIEAIKQNISNSESEVAELEPDTEDISNIPVSKSDISVAALNLSNITIWRSTFKDVQTEFGDAYVFHAGDAGGSLYWVCYKGKDGTILSFESGEMGGDEHTIIKVRIFANRAVDFGKGCSRSDKVSMKTKFQNGMGLEVSRENFEKLLGVPGRKTDNIIVYVYEATAKLSGQMEDSISTITLRTQNGKNTEISVSRVAEYY